MLRFACISMSDFVGYPLNSRLFMATTLRGRIIDFRSWCGEWRSSWKTSFDSGGPFFDSHVFSRFRKRRSTSYRTISTRRRPDKNVRNDCTIRIQSRNGGGTFHFGSQTNRRHSKRILSFSIQRRTKRSVAKIRTITSLLRRTSSREIGGVM